MGLFDSFRAGGLELPNRLAMAPMTQNQSPGNVLSPANIQRYAARAKGGVGLIITEGMLIDLPTAGGGWGTDKNRIPILRAGLVESLKQLVAAVHAEGGRLMVQVWHQGPKFPGGTAPVANEQATVRAMTTADVCELLDAYKVAAQVLVQAGVDGAELHAAHGYLLHACLKHGEKEMAGGMTGRGFVREVVGIFASALRGKGLLQLRFSQWEVDNYDAKYLADPGELRDLLLPLRDAGVQVFHASTRRWWLPAFDGQPDTLAALTRRITGTPTMAVGSFGHRVEQLRGTGPEGLIAAQAAVARGDFELMAVGRPLLSDADFVQKMQASRWDEIKETNM